MNNFKPLAEIYFKKKSIDINEDIKVVVMPRNKGKKLNEEYFNYFIFGHRHCPLEIDLGNNSKYLNTGDWISFYSYIEYDGTSFSFKYFKD